MTRLDYELGKRYCGFCGSEKKPDEIKRDKKGAPLCKRCGHKIRTIAHNKRSDR